MHFITWLDTFVDEKDLDVEDILEVDGESGTNFIPLGALLDVIKEAPQNEQTAIKAVLVKIDLINGDVMDYFRHLSKAIAV